MPSGYKSKNNKLDENALTQCDKCECLILSDSSDPNNDKCIHPRRSPPPRTPYTATSGDAVESSPTGTPAFTLKPKAKSTIKIFISEDSTISTNDKTTSTDCPPTANDSEVKKKHMCFRFCRKKKKPGKETKDPKKSKEEEKQKEKEQGKDEAQEKEEDKEKQEQQDDANQTSKANVNNSKTQSSDVDLEEMVAKAACACAKSGGAGGGCNTNTIIFPKDRSAGDGASNLESFIKQEARANGRYLEDILAEVAKQRRDIQELKEMLDAIVRGLRDHLFMTTFAKEKHDLFEDFRRMNNLERKNNSLSMTKTTESEDGKKAKSEDGKKPKGKESRDAKSAPPGGQKKKKFCPWCR